MWESRIRHTLYIIRTICLILFILVAHENVTNTVIVQHLTRSGATFAPHYEAFTLLGI